jgi:hypothetical protein
MKYAEIRRYAVPNISSKHKGGSVWWADVAGQRPQKWAMPYDHQGALEGKVLRDQDELDERDLYEC